jgi:serine/threonine protein kinase
MGDATKRRGGGTLWYQAPELFDSAPFLQPADVYAFGVLAAETMHPDPRWRPWPAGTSEMKIVVEITR